ncbi:MAG: hypothetical protein HZB68_03210 [Candidatus Aenigmarchaeota archaeon]|nr:hypothetical protein [Candidatus Aenigmarchaeota archaeon]
MDFRLEVKGATTGKTIENVSIATITVAAIMVVLGISLGSYVSGFPVMLAMGGSFLVFIGIIVFVIGEFVQIYETRGR